MDEKQRKAIRVRLALRTLAMLGLAAIVGQLVAYSFLARREIAGTLWETERFEASDIGIAIQIPNTWEARLASSSPEIRIELRGPVGVGGELVVSRGALSALPVQDEAGLKPLSDMVHTAMARRLLADLGSISEDPPEPSNALDTPGLVSFFNANKEGKPHKGVRYSWVDMERAWGMVLVSPQEKWEESVPVFSRITSRLRATSL